MKNFFLNRIKKKLIIGFSYKAGRNFLGRKTIYTQGGGKFAKFISIDYKRILPFSYKLINIYKDFNRNSLIGFICYEIGIFSYILLSDNKFELGQVFRGFIFNTNNLSVGNSTFLGNIELGNILHHIELLPGCGAQLVRSSGTKAVLISKDDKNSLIKLPSGWLVMLSNFCVVLFGMVAQNKKRLEKAGQNRNIGFKPRVRGIAMNPCDHPHGGGSGKKPKPAAPKTPWGKLTRSPTIKTKVRYILKKNFKKEKK